MTIRLLSSFSPARFASTALLTTLAALAGCADVALEGTAEEGDDIALASIEQGLVSHVPSAFTMANAYNGTSLFGSSCSSSSKMDLVGHEPATAGKFPVAVWLTGTLADFKGDGALAFTASMAARGFVAATVEYANSTYPSCGAMKTKASCVFDASSSNSAIAKLCARAKADCSKGIVVAGISQGANLASLSKNYDARVKGAYLLSNVVAPSFYNNSACLSDAATKLAKNEVRIISAESDEFEGSVSKVRSALHTATGYKCTGYDCLQADGSGWYIVSDAQVQDGKADHCYLLNGGCSGTTADKGYETSSAVWAGVPNVDWLASRISR